jgi:sugar phosphate isomerase/epimerase
MQQSRRNFLRTGTIAAVGIPFAMQTVQKSEISAAEQTKPTFDFELGLASYTFREFNREQCIAMAKRVNLKKICFKSMHLPMNATNEECRRAAEECKEAGLELVGAGVCYMNSADEVNNTFRYAKAAGLQQIVGVPKHELLPLVEEKVKETGIAVAIHNHGPGDKLYPTPASVLEKIDGLDKRIGVCNDIGHTVRSGVDAAKSILECGDRLLSLHIKDETAAEAKGNTIICGRGIIDFPPLIEALVQIKYRGSIDFEYEADAKDPLPGLAESVGFVRGVMKTMSAK